PRLSLDELRFFVGGAGDTGASTGYDTTTNKLAGSLTPVYDLGAGNWILLNAGLNPGSGKGDMLAYIPDAVFGAGATNSFVYLYSKFGANVAGNGGFEEWAAGKSLVTSAAGSISGTVTLNGTGVADFVVFLDANHNGLLDSNEVSTFTDANGNYS